METDPRNGAWSHGGSTKEIGKLVYGGRRLKERETGSLSPRFLSHRRLLELAAPELVSNNRVVALFSGEKAAKQRTTMHSVLWNW